MIKKKYNGKVGYFSNKDLGIPSANSKSGHYVYERADNGNKCALAL